MWALQTTPHLDAENPELAQDVAGTSLLAGPPSLRFLALQPEASFEGAGHSSHSIEVNL